MGGIAPAGKPMRPIRQQWVDSRLERDFRAQPLFLQLQNY
jgi:hypothetical protein